MVPVRIPHQFSSRKRLLLQFSAEEISKIPIVLGNRSQKKKNSRGTVVGTITVVSGFVPIYILLQLGLSWVYWGLYLIYRDYISSRVCSPETLTGFVGFFVEVDGSKNPMFQAEMDQTRSMLEIQQEERGLAWEMGRDPTGKWEKMMYIHDHLHLTPNHDH